MRIAVLGVAVIMGLAMLEMACRALFFQRHDNTPAWAVAHYAQAVRSRIDRLTHRPIGIYKPHERFGYAHLPNTQGRHRGRGFDVTYTIDEHGHRICPTPERPLGEIMFLGCSCTFGQGVEDGASYSHVLADRYWPEWQIRNTAVSGWGTGHAYLRLQDAMDSASPPAYVFYAMIPHHIRRNAMRESYVRSLQTKQGVARFPRFDLVADRLVYRGLADAEEAVPDALMPRGTEIGISSAMLVGMHRLCLGKKVPFVVILLPQAEHNAWPPSFIMRLVADGIPFLDLSALPYRGIPFDGHPTVDEHRRIAAAIASAFSDEFQP